MLIALVNYDEERGKGAVRKVTLDGIWEKVPKRCGRGLRRLVGE